MNKTEFQKLISEKLNVTQPEGKVIVDTVLDTITEVLSTGEKLQLNGFGNFEVRETAERKGRNPQTNEEVIIPAGKRPAWKAAKAVKDAVNG